MSVIRDRAKSNFPMVLLTLLSIVQALAFELLWSAVHEHPDFYEWSWSAFNAWVRVAAMLLGIIIIWSSYATNVMRFRWVPSTSDTFFPFFIGIVQFVMIDWLGTQDTAGFFLCLAVLFALMNWITHHDMSRARQHAENSEFFDRRGRASWQDFIPVLVIVMTFILSSLIIWLTVPDGWIAGGAGLFALGLMIHQVVNAHGYWEESMSLDATTKEE
ncbi:MAG: hypothetical protein ACJAX5_003246 [Patiriisocius sp.]|jgi:hypothetical protein